MDSPFAINFAVKEVGGKVIEKSLLLNVRGSELSTIISNFQAIRVRLNGDLSGASLPQLPEARPQVAVIEPEAQQDEYPYPGNCERCGAAMFLRTARRGKNIGSKFWSCGAYSRGCLSTKPA